MIKQLQFGKKRVNLYLPDDASDKLPVIWLLDMNKDALKALLDMDTEGRLAGIAIAQVCVSNWNDDLTPWKAPVVFGKGEFGGRFDEFSNYVINEVMPLVERKYPVLADAQNRAVAGYSLGGLASLMFFLNTDLFGSLASMSGSLWYPDLFEYVDTKIGSKTGCFSYFSLGDTEQTPMKEQFSHVNADHEKMVKIFGDHFGSENTFFEWNTGDHGTDVLTRMYKGLSYLAAYLTK